VQLSWPQRFRMALDVARGMNFLHTMDEPLLHRDLKSLNLLVSEPVRGVGSHVQIKVADFGLARHKDEDDGGEDETSRMTGMAGTFHWMAPEVLRSEPYSNKADVYSYGIVLWEICSREPPFAKLKPHEIMN
jgi:serine/threonine protein kinase